MKRVFDVEWYECDLTERRHRMFLTYTGACLFGWWVRLKYGVNVKVYIYE